MRRADAFAFSPDTDRETAERIWFASGAAVYVAESGGHVVGTCYIKPNQPGLGDHVANGGFMVARAARGQGIGRRLGAFAIREAARLGYRGMQFNFVVASNEGALTLWQSLGFAVIGRVPEAFRHGTDGFTDIVILYRPLARDDASVETA